MDNKPTERIKCSVQGTLCVNFKIKRDDLDKPLDEDDKKLLNQSGIYFLFGETSDSSAKEIVYIGQAGVRKNGKALLNRLKEHSRKKDYQNEAVATDIILSVLNYKVFVPLIEKTTSNKSDDIFYLTRTIRKTGVTVNAKGQLTRDGFVVFKGSYISAENLKAIPETIRKQRLTAKIDKNRILQEDLHFTSPSYAAAFVIGSNVNGQTYWKTNNGVQALEDTEKVEK